jgi:hypothetical protein
VAVEIDTFGMSDDDDSGDNEDSYAKLSIRKPKQGVHAAAVRSEKQDSSCHSPPHHSVFDHLDSANIPKISPVELQRRKNLANCLPVFCGLLSLSAPAICQVLSPNDLDHPRQEVLFYVTLSNFN